MREGAFTALERSLESARFCRALRKQGEWDCMQHCHAVQIPIPENYTNLETCAMHMAEISEQIDVWHNA